LLAVQGCQAHARRLSQRQFQSSHSLGTGKCGGRSRGELAPALSQLAPSLFRIRSSLVGQWHRNGR
jgi:hypothetical protein